MTGLSLNILVSYSVTSTYAFVFLRFLSGTLQELFILYMLKLIHHRLDKVCMSGATIDAKWLDNLVQCYFRRCIVGFYARYISSSGQEELS